jgi:hypothetical protein
MIDTETLNSWIVDVQGKYINEDWNPTNQGFGNQCWDLAANWSKRLGLPVINTGGNGRWPGWAGNMVDAFPQTQAIAAAYTLHGPDEQGQPGDIVVWGDSYWYYPATHVAVLVADKGNQLQCMSQNSTPSRTDNPYPGLSSGPTTIQSLPRQGLIGLIRPSMGIQFQSTTTAPAEEDIMASIDELVAAITRPDVLDAIARAVQTRQVPYLIDGQDTGQGTTIAAMVGNNDSNIITTRRVIAETAAATVHAIFDTAIDRAGGTLGGQTSLAAVIAWFDANVEGIVNEVRTDPDGIDQAQVTAAINAATKEALSGISITITNSGDDK